MNRKRPVLVTLPLLVVPLAFSVVLGGERGRRAPLPAPSSAEGTPKAPAADNGTVAKRAVPLLPGNAAARPPLRIANVAARPVAAPRSAEPPREQRSESFTLEGPDPSVDDQSATVDFMPVGDPKRTETTAVASAGAASVDDYGAAPE